MSFGKTKSDTGGSFFDKAKKLLRYAGLDKEKFQLIREEYIGQNLTALMGYCIIIALIGLYQGIRNIFAADYSVSIYFGLSALELVIFCYCFKYGRTRQKLIMPCVYFNNLLLYAVGIILGVVHPDESGTIIMVLVALLPTMFYDIPLHNIIQILVIATVYLITAYELKTPEIFNIDKQNMLCFALAGMVIGTILMKIKANSVYTIHSLENSTEEMSRQKFDLEVRQAIAEDYDFVGVISLDNYDMTCCHISDTAVGVLPLSEGEVVDFETYRDVLLGIVYPEDLETFKRMAYFALVAEKLKENPTYKFEFRMIVDGRPQYFEEKFSRIGDRTDVMAIGFLNEDERVQHSRAQGEEAGLKNALAFAETFMDTYISSYYVDLDSCSMIIFSCSDHVREQYGNTDNYLESIREYIRCEVHEDDRAAMYEAVEPAYIRSRLENEDRYFVEMRDISSGDIQWYRFDVMRGADSSHAALAFTDITEQKTADEKIKQYEREARELKHAEQLAVISNLANDFDYIIALDWKQNKTTRYRASDRYKKVLAGLDPALTDTEKLEAFFEKIVYPDDMAMFRQNAALEKIEKHLSEHSNYKFEFRTIDDNGKIEYYRIMMAFVPENRDVMIIGLSNIDFLVRNQIKIVEQAAALKNLESAAILVALGTDYEEIDYLTINSSVEDDELSLVRYNESLAKEYPFIAERSSYHDRLETFADTLLHPDDRDEFIRKTRRGELMKKLAISPSYFLEFRMLYNNEVKYYQAKFVAEKDPEGNIRGLVVGVRSNDEQIRQRKLIEQAKAGTVIAGLAEDFDYVCYIDTKTSAVTRYRASERFAQIIDSYNKNVPSGRRLDMFFNSIIHPDDIETFKRTTERAKMMMQLEKTGRADVFFRIILDGRTLYYALRFAMDVNNPSGVIMGIYSVDEQTRRTMKNKELETRQTVLAAANERAERTIVMRSSELQERNRELSKANEEIVELLGNVVEMRDNASGEHVRRVKAFSYILAKTVMEDLPEYGLNENDVDVISSASALHDVGKILIPDSILLKPGKLTKDEFDLMKTHTIRGYEILKKAPPSWSEKYLSTGLEICLYHHEKYDGNGYPEGLKGDEIPISAQIVAIADCYDALSTPRVYKEAYSCKDSFNMIMNGECGVFSDKLLACFKKCEKAFEEAAESPDEFIDDVDITDAGDRLQGLRILLVDDNVMSLEIDKDILEGEGAITDTATSGPQALELFENDGPYDAIIMDMIMPGMNGDETTRRIRELEKDKADSVPIIALSAEVITYDDEMLSDAGFNGVLEKPLVVGEFTKAMLACMRERSEAMEAKLAETMKMANTDALTRVKNISAYTDAIEELTGVLNSAYRAEFGIVMCDVNDLKAVNDTFGHDVGDIYIINCCRILSYVFNHSPVFRIGGDEFAVILRDKDYEQRDIKLESLGAELRHAMQIDTIESGMASMAFGMAVYNPTSDTSVSDVVKRADTAMYDYKRKFKANLKTLNSQC